MPFQIRRKEEGERGKREKKRKREVTVVIRKFQLISIWEFMMIPLHTTDCTRNLLSVVI